MEAKEKALELFDKFSDYVDYNEDDCLTQREVMHKNAKQCALIAVDEQIKTLRKYEDVPFIQSEVMELIRIKTEIENL